MLRFPTTQLPITYLWELALKLCFSQSIPTYIFLLCVELVKQLILLKSANHFTVFLIISFSPLIVLPIILFQLNGLLTGTPYYLADSIRTTFQKIIPRIVLFSFMTAIVMAVGFMIFIIPGVYFLIIFMSISYPVLLFNKLEITESLVHCIKLIWGNWWRSAAIIVMPIILTFIVGMIIEIWSIKIVSGLFHLPVKLATLLEGPIFGLMMILISASSSILLWNDLQLRYAKLNSNK